MKPPFFAVSELYRAERREGLLPPLYCCIVSLFSLVAIQRYSDATGQAKKQGGASLIAIVAAAIAKRRGWRPSDGKAARAFMIAKTALAARTGKAKVP